MSGGLRMQIRRGDEDKDAGKPEKITEMQKVVEGELEHRRKDWETEVDRLQKDFFKSSVSTAGSQVPTKKSGQDIFDIMNSESLYQTQPDGSKIYRVHFDVKGFAPDEVQVRAEGRKITVEAKHEADFGSGSRTAKQFNRSVELPRLVDPDTVTSFLSDDGVLSLEAPVVDDPEEMSLPLFNVENRFEGSEPFLEHRERMFSGEPHIRRYQYSSTIEPPAIERTHFSSSRHTRPGFEPLLYEPNVIHRSYYNTGPVSGTRIVRRLEPQTTKIIRHTAVPMSPVSSHTTTTRRVIHCDRSDSPTNISISRDETPKTTTSGNSNIENTEYGKKLKLIVDIGSDYDASDITVKPLFRKISVHAVKEEKIGGRSSRREFSRDFDIGEEIEPRTLRASLAANGKLHIGASIAGNVEHDIVLGFVIQDLPRGGQLCKVEQQ